MKHYRKTLRGSQKQGAPGVHLLSALSHHVGLTLTQQAVDAKTNEITQVETVLRQIVLKDRVVTMDALLTQRHVAQTIVDEGGDYVMIVKEHQPQLRADIALVFTLPPAGDCQETLLGNPVRDHLFLCLFFQKYYTNYFLW